MHRSIKKFILKKKRSLNAPEPAQILINVKSDELMPPFLKFIGDPFLHSRMVFEHMDPYGWGSGEGKSLSMSEVSKSRLCESLIQNLKEGGVKVAILM